MTRVVHCKKEPYDVYIGRPSKWGNPFVIGRDGTRNEVVEKYRLWLYHNTDLLGEINQLRGKILGCFCKPAKCHGDVLADLADSDLRGLQSIPLVLPAEDWLMEDDPYWLEENKE